MKKRLFDLIIAVLLLISLSPFLIFITLVLSVFTVGKPFFVQLRIGKNNQSFPMYKFRTMAASDTEDWKPGLDAGRITFLGKFLRAYSLDEFPQLWNVLFGHMSLVGPRPLPLEYLPLFSTEQLKRHDIKPGITGWAQINGRNAISWDERFELDVWYVENASTKLDFMILFKTGINLLNRKGINKSKDLTMDKFTGTKN